jgi:hypothetical protein
MNKTKKLLGISFGLIALLIVAGVTLAFTQAPEQSQPTAADEPFQARQHRDEALAAALDISLEELQAARQEAFDVALDQLVAEGLISEERAALMRARSAFLTTLDRDEIVAQALGISAAELQAARDEGQSPRQLARALELDPGSIRQNLAEARAAAIEAAVASGLITPEQGQLLAGNPRPIRPERPNPRARANRAYQERGFHRGREIFDAALAGALNVTVDELEAARQEALTATLELAVEEGRIAAERADLILARAALARAVEPDDVLALALGISTDDLQEARDNGQTLGQLVNELGLDPASVRENIQSARDQLIDQALASGDITKEQAKLLRDAPGGDQRRFRENRRPGRPNPSLPGG